MSDKLLGLVFGQAIGDAVGRYFEFMYKDSINRKYSREQFDFPPYKIDMLRPTIQVCDFTDDTQQMTLIMDMLIELNNKIDINLFAKKLKNWATNGIPELGYDRGIGIGNLTFSLVNMPNFESNPLECSKQVWQGIMAPNGSIMRTSILAYRNLPYEQTIEDAISISMVSHYDPRCTISVAVIVSILWDVLNNTSEDIILNRAKEWCSKFKGSFKHFGFDEYTTYEEESLKYFNMKKLDDIKLEEQIGYTLKCMACGIYAFRNRKRLFKDVLLEIVFEGGDADTNAAVACSILGAYQGYDKLPDSWLKKMPHYDWLLTKSRKFLNIL